jgi:putative membrane protein
MRKIATLVCACACVLAAAAIPAAAESSVSGLDEEYLQTSMKGDHFEILGGKIALAISHNAKVRALARRLIKDHTKSLADAKKFAKTYGIETENSATKSEQWELRVIGAMRGAAFDRWYTRLEVADHRQDIEEATTEVEEGFNSAIRADAKQELPILRTHLKLSEAALRAVK